MMLYNTSMFRLALLCYVAVSALARDPMVRLRLDTASGKTQFHIGQPVPIKLIFETTGTQSLAVSTEVQPRRLRPQKPDEFTAEPATGWMDPLKELPWTMEPFANPTLSQRQAALDAANPVFVERALNEFIVFRRPGRYVIHCTSSRLLNGAKLPSTGLALDILPRDDEETARQFASARAILEIGKPPREPELVFYTERENAQTEAVRTLRYLDTAEAVTYLAAIYGQGRRTDPEIEFALYASEHHEPIVRELERRMAEPDLTLTQGYLVTLIELKALWQETLTGRPLAKGDWTALDEEVNKRVFELAARKTPEAKAGTYFYLFETGSPSFRQTPEMLRLLVDSLPSAAAFQVEVLLSSNWGEIRTAAPRLVPFLKEAVVRSWPKMTPSIAGLALLRLAELDRTAANDLALRALLTGVTSIGDVELLDFPVPASPELDRALLSQYRQGKPVEARIARYASPGIEDDLWSAYDAGLKLRGEPECATPLLAYFFRVDPIQAASRIARLRKPQEYPCSALQFYGLERRLMSPGLERQLIQDTQSSVPAIRSAALQGLSLAGSPAALPELLRSLDPASAVRQEIIAAILRGRNWVLTDADFARLLKDCGGTPYCDGIARVQRESAAPYTLRLFDFAGHQGVWLCNRQVDNLADLENLLTQYPTGAQFRWQAAGTTLNSEEREMRDRVLALLGKHGMHLLEP